MCPSEIQYTRPFGQKVVMWFLVPSEKKRPNFHDYDLSLGSQPPFALFLVSNRCFENPPIPVSPGIDHPIAV
jgi:hypothetical protein